MPWLIPRTAAKVMSSGASFTVRLNALLTFGSSVTYASGRHWVGDDRRDVDDAASFFGDSRSEGPVIGVLRVDCIGNTGVHNEGAVGIDVHHLLEEL